MQTRLIFQDSMSLDDRNIALANLRLVSHSHTIALGSSLTVCVGAYNVIKSSRIHGSSP